MEKCSRLLYVGELLYIGMVDESELKSGAKSIDIEYPLILTIKPVGNDSNQLEAVITDLVLPLEFAGIPVSDGLYSGFVNFAPATIEVDQPNVQYITNPQGQRVAITRLITLVSKRSPIITVYNVLKSFIPSEELLSLYEKKLQSYNFMMNSTRMIQNQKIGNEQPASTEKSQVGTTGRVVDFKNTSM